MEILKFCWFYFQFLKLISLKYIWESLQVIIFFLINTTGFILNFYIFLQTQFIMVTKFEKENYKHMRNE